MATLVSFHAHPDDESITTGGTLARAASEGHRVVLVVATNGDHGEAPDDLGEGESLVDRRRSETARSAAVLGIARVVWLGYDDSGMTGWSQNSNVASFWQAPVEEAAERLAAVLREEAADVLTVYDWHGGYGHPDHIQVHRVGRRAAELAGTPRVYQNTINRDHIARGMQRFTDDENAGPPEAVTEESFGKPESVITAAVDVTAYIRDKRRAMRAHASQISEQSFFLAMPDDAFAYAFGTEWFIRDGQGPGITETDLLAGL